MSERLETNSLADVLTATYGAVTDAVAPLADADFVRATRCRGLSVGDLLIHLLYDAQRALIAFATPRAAPADRDRVTYWTDFPGPPSDDNVFRAARFLRAASAAYTCPSRHLVEQWRETSQAAARAAGSAGRHGYVGTQGHVLAVPDFIATLITEAAIHHLDLLAELPAGTAPEPLGLAVAAATMDGLMGSPVAAVAGWDQATYLLKATGRLPVAAAEYARLGELAHRLPVLG